MRAWQVTVALVLALPVAAFAAGEDVPVSVQAVNSELLRDLPNVSLGVHIGFQDVHALVPYTGTGTPSFSGVSGGAVLTLGGTYRNRLGADSPWYVDAGGGVGFGGSKLEVGGTIDVTQKDNFSSVYGNVGGGYIQPITRRTSVYGGGRLFYSSTKLKYDNGTDEYTGEPFKVYGFEPNIGCRHQLSPKLSFSGEFYQQFGWGSGEVGDTKINETLKYGCWRGSLMFSL